MKKIHIIAILIIAASIVIFITASKDVSTYANFEIAETTGQRVKIVGQLDLSKDVVFAPEVDPNKTTFHMKDEDGKIREVVLLQPKPQDFEMSEQIVLTGEIQEGQFVADEILMKCPSKYKNEEIFLKSET
ncbi:MAG: cytochrome c maturation protein CcmE [Saprospiraceae bacterium]|nr:cytochrome c maturation protein CcmE [Saprospiraceae bacterium]